MADSVTWCDVAIWSLSREKRAWRGHRNLAAPDRGCV